MNEMAYKLTQVHGKVILKFGNTCQQIVGSISKASN